jgi:hypothetical protein
MVFIAVLIFASPAFLPQYFTSDKTPAGTALAICSGCPQAAGGGSLTKG